MKRNEWAMTGNFQYLNKDIVKSILINIGHDLKSKLTEKTDYLLCGSNPGSKLVKAQFSGIVIITEKQFLSLLGIEI
ncbi:MAG: BRCT domain-containing protein [bacterium]